MQLSPAFNRIILAILKEKTVLYMLGEKVQYATHQPPISFFIYHKIYPSQFAKSFVGGASSNARVYSPASTPKDMMMLRALGAVTIEDKEIWEEHHSDFRKERWAMQSPVFTVLYLGDKSKLETTSPQFVNKSYLFPYCVSLTVRSGLNKNTFYNYPTQKLAESLWTMPAIVKQGMFNLCGSLGVMAGLGYYVAPAFALLGYALAHHPYPAWNIKRVAACLEFPFYLSSSKLAKGQAFFDAEEKKESKPDVILVRKYN